MDRRVEHGACGGWLAPVALDSPRKKVREKHSFWRASNEGCLPLTLDHDLKLRNWTGRQPCKDKTDQIPAEFDPILERLDCSAESWLDLKQNFRKRLRTEAGLAASMHSVRSARRHGALNRSRLRVARSDACCSVTGSVSDGLCVVGRARASAMPLRRAFTECPSEVAVDQGFGECHRTALHFPRIPEPRSRGSRHL